MAYRGKEFAAVSGASVVDVSVGTDAFDGSLIVHLKEGAGESVTVSSVSQVFVNAAGAETLVSVTPTATLTAGKTLEFKNVVVSPKLRITLSGVPVSDTRVEIITKW